MNLHRAMGPLQVLVASLTWSAPPVVPLPQIPSAQLAVRPASPGTVTLCQIKLSSAARLPGHSGTAGADGLVWALRDAFERKDLEGYSALLADDFIFRYRPEDLGPGECDTLDRAGELAFATHLFTGGAASGAPPADSIRLSMEILDRSSDPGDDRWCAFLVMTHLRAYLPGGDTITVDGPQCFLARRAAGEGGQWQLVEWVDVSNSVETLAAVPLRRAPLGAGGDVRNVRPSTLREIPAVFAVGAPWPNPSNAGARLGYAMPAAGRLRADLYSVDGRRARVLHDAVLRAGTGTMALDTRGLAPGVYYMRVEVGGRVFARRLVVVK